MACSKFVNLLQNFVNLELGDTIGKSLRSANMFFEGSELIRYDTGLIHTKQTNIQTSEKRSRTRKTNIHNQGIRSHLTCIMCALISYRSVTFFGCFPL